MSISSILKCLDDQSWFVASCGDGSKGASVYDWQALEIELPVEGWRRYLLVRRVGRMGK